ncbi:MAG TPA: hypothetical protein VFD56_10475, partial [Chitinophagaceae bacterium]|nr:hypothetical protein [Chitinophagaceae bacterium]
MSKISLVILLLVTLTGFAQTTDYSFGRNGASFVNLYDSVPGLYPFDHDIDAAGNLYIIANLYIGGSSAQSDQDHIIIKVNAAGKIDSSFFESGYRSLGHGIINFFNPWPYGYHPPNFVKVSNDQSRIYVFSNGLSLRLKQNGQTDSTYGNNGYVLHPNSS